MRFILWSAIVVCALFVGCLAPSCADVIDPGFEMTTLLWDPWGIDTQAQGAWELTTDNPHGGQKCVKASALGYGQVYEQGLLQYHNVGTGRLTLLPNTTYKLSYWARNSDTIGDQWLGGRGAWSDSWAKNAVLFYNSSGQNIGASGDIAWVSSLLPQWTQVEGIFTTPANTAYGYLVMKCHLNKNATGESNIWYDDVSVAQTEPSVNNTGFENSTWSPWTAVGGGNLTWARTTSNPHSGSRCALAAGGSTAPYEGRLQWADKPAYPNTDYRFSIWVRNTGSNWGTYGESYSQNWFKVTAQEADATGNWGVPGSHDLVLIESSVPGWTRYVTDFTTSPTTTQLRITIRGHLAAVGVTAAFDDVALLMARGTKISWLPFDLQSMKDTIAAGADVTGIGIKDLWYSFYPSTVCTPSPYYGDGTIVRQAIAHAHDMGVVFAGAIPPCMDASVLTAHPEWRRRYTDSTSWLTAPADQVTGCLVSPYGDYLIDEVKEAAQVLGMDGVTFDGYNYLTCYCDYCKAKFLADTGHGIPSSANYGDPVYRQYVLWQDAQITDHLNRMKAAVRAVSPKFDFYIWSTNAGRYGHFLTSPRVMPTELNQLFDCSMQEWWADESNIGLSVIPDFGAKYLGAVSRGSQWLAEPYLFTHVKDLGPGPWASSLPQEEIWFRIYSALAAGSTICFAGGTDTAYMCKPVFDAVEARRPWTHKAESLPYAALVVSEPTRQFYGRNDPVNLYMNNCFGFYAALVEQHIPVDLITHTDLRGGLASRYKVLILPNMACMSDADIAAVRAFVSTGGGVVATGATSLYDEQGVARAEYALADLLKVTKSGSKVNLQSRVTIGETLFGRNSTELGKLLSPTGRVTSFVGEAFPVNLLMGGISMATVCTSSACSATWPLYVTNTNSGNGRVAYFPACIDAGYFRNPYPYEAILLRDAVLWTANSTPPVTVVAPKDLQVTYFTQPFDGAQGGGERLVIHLLNARNTVAGRAYPADDVPVRDEVTPIRNIEVWFESATPTSVILLPENTALATVQVGGRTKVVVSEVRQHSMVVADIP